MRSALEVVRHESALGCWELAFRPAVPLLRPFVDRIEGYREWGVQPVRRRELPWPGVVLIISFGSRFRLESPANEAGTGTFASFVGGISTAHVFSQSLEPFAGMQINLTPVGARMVFDRPMEELTGRVVPLGDLLGPAAEALEGRLAEAESWEARFALVEEVLLERLAQAREVPRELLRAWARLRREGGLVEVGALAGELGWSRKHLSVRFRQELGLAPRPMARLVRFDRAQRLLAQGRESHARVAAACGYFDQAHLVREFRALAGVTPGGYQRLVLGDGSGIVEPAAAR